MNESVKYPQIIYGLIVALGAFLLGCCIGATAPHDHDVMKQTSFADKDWGLENWWVRACLPLSAFGFCKLASLNLIRKGPVMTLKIAGIIFFIAIVLYIPYFWNDEKRKDFALLFPYRIVLGLGCGLVTTALPVLLAEIAQDEIRGTIGSFFYLYFIIGVLFAYCLLVFVNLVWTSLFGIVITLVFLISVHRKLDTPLHLMKIGNEAAAEKTLKRLRGQNFDAKAELDAMRQLVLESKSTQATLLQRFVSAGTRRALLICIGLMFWQQFTGIHTVLLTTTTTFEENLKDNVDKRFYFIIVMSLQIFGSLIATMLVDVIGRRPLLLISTLGMTAFMLGLLICFCNKLTGWAPFSMLSLFVISHSIGFGPVPWIMLGELFSLDAKEIAVPLVAGCFWLFHYLTFDVGVAIKATLGTRDFGYLFWVHTSILMLACFFVYFLVPETKRRSSQEIQEMLLKKDEPKTNI